MPNSDALNWLETLEAFEVDWSAPIVVAGLDAGAFADEISRRSASGIAAEGGDWVLLAGETPAATPGSWVDLPQGIAGTVIVRRAWTDRPGLSRAAAAAARLVAAGGRLFLADVDANRLLDSSPVYYPYQLRFTLDPVAAQTLLSTSTSTADLALEVGRAGMRAPSGVVVDEERGVYGAAADYWAAVRDGSWPSLGEMPADARDVLLEDLAVELTRIAPIGEIVDRRPWFVATGRRV